MKRAGHHEWVPVFFRHQQIWKKAKLRPVGKLRKSGMCVPTGKQPRSAHTPWLLQQKKTSYRPFLNWYGKRKMTVRKNLTNAANIHIKTSTLGKIGRRPKRQRSRREPSVATMENNGNRSKSRQYKLKWLKDTKAFKCFRCESAIRIPGEIPLAPDDVIAFEEPLTQMSRPERPL